MDLRLKPGGVTTLIGPNGCGKSTLLKAMTRILKCRGGSILLEGKEIRKMPTKELAQKISILSQHQITPDDITVQDLVSYGRMPYQKWYQGESREDVEIVRWAMEAASVAHMADRQSAQPFRRRAAARGSPRRWHRSPAFLFLDEPTTLSGHRASGWRSHARRSKRLSRRSSTSRDHHGAARHRAGHGGRGSGRLR